MTPCPFHPQRFADAFLSIRVANRPTSYQPLYFLYPRSIKPALSRSSSSVTQKSEDAADESANEAASSLRDVLSSPTLRTKALVKDPTRPAIGRSRKQFRHDELRYKGPRSWDFNAPLTSLRKSTSNRYSLSSDQVSKNKLKPIELHDNDYVGVEVSAIPMPKIWTRSSFAQYVHDLCQSQMPHQLARGNQHQNMIRRLLEHKLFVPGNAHLVTTEALDLAIKFYYKLELVHVVRKLHGYAKRIGPHLSNGVFDTMLRNAAIKHDMHIFTSLLNEALSSEFVPSEKTWTSLLICLRDSKARQIVLKEMDERGLLTAEETREDIDTARLELMLSQNPIMLENIPELEGQMDTELGKNWLTIRSANTLLQRLCELPASQPIVDFLDMVTARGCTLNLDSLNLFLVRHYRCADLGTAVKVLDSFISHYSVVPDQTSYALLFGTAWKLRYVNSCRVLWAAACLHRRATYSIRSRLLESLALPPDSKESAIHRWKWQAGRLIAGIESGNLANVENSKLAVLLEDDQSLYQNYYYPLKLVVSQLAEAYELDQRWRTTDLHTKPIHELRNLMIEPSLRKMEYSSKPLLVNT